MFWKENNQKLSIHDNTFKSIEKKIRTNTIQNNWAHTKKNPKKTTNKIKMNFVLPNGK
jgi:hypothetical protein